mgnify:CR=1 FL=1
MAFKMKNFSGFGNSPMKQKGRFGISGLSSSEKAKFFKESKKRAKEAFKRDAAKSGHGTIEDLKAKNKKNFEKFQSQKQKGKEFVKKLKPQISKKPAGTLSRIAKTFGVKQALKRVGPVGAVLTAYDIAKTAKKAIPGLKRKAKSGNVNIGRKI